MSAEDGPQNPKPARWIWLMPVFALMVWLIAHQDIPWQLWGGDEMEYADVARRLARGDGFTASLIYPVELEWGATRDHPSLFRAPVWPMTQAAVFAITGPKEWAISLILLVLFCACVASATALGLKLAGVWAAVLAGLAVATSPHTLALSFFGGTETLFSFLVLLVFLLLAQGQRAIWVGMVCGLLYLTRYNGIVLLPVVLTLLILDRSSKWTLIECAAGFALVALPWWIRNALITGNPFFTYYQWAIYFSPYTRSYTTTLVHMLEPDIGAPTAMNPFEKARVLLPALVMNWPLASANLSACIGVGLACVRRDRLAACFAILALATTVGLAFALPRGRYFAPLFPALLVLGVTSWIRYGRVWKWLGLPFLLVAPLLPPFPPESPDLKFMRKLVREYKADEPLTHSDPWLPCLKQAEAPLIMGENASRIAWMSDVTTIWLPATEQDFWRIVETHPIEFVFISTRKDLLTSKFLEHFKALPECGVNLYRRTGGSACGPGS
jgi:4-amino-4-deoxy-L-arabinose transferase-like glycosyltransferase